MRGPPCPGCGRRVPGTLATCLACGAETGDRLTPIAVGLQGAPALIQGAEATGPAPASLPGRTLSRGRVIGLLLGVAVLAGLNLLPSVDDPTAVAPAAVAEPVEIPRPPAAGLLARAAEAARQPGVVWPPPGPLRDRQDYTSLWTGTHMTMWNGATPGRALTGSTYDSATREWRAATPGPIQSRSHPAAIWAGREVLLWGGLSAAGVPLGDGAAYDPATDTWRAIAPSPLSPREPLVAAWTGREVLVV
ncbi:MAG: hypothetical protein ACRDZ7_08880, partial [Acidimicrobiia bacterium]